VFEGSKKAIKLFFSVGNITNAVIQGQHPCQETKTTWHYNAIILLCNCSC